MTVTVVFAGTADGHIESNDPNRATAQAGASLAATTNTTTMTVGQLVFGDYIVYEGFVNFDTSAIPDTDTVVTVDLDLWLDTDNSATDFFTSASFHDWGAGLTTADWLSAAQLITLDGGGTVNGPLANINSSGIGSTGAYKTWTSEYNAGSNDFRAVTNMKTGTVSLILYSRRHRNGNTPTGNEYIIWGAADEAGTTEDPKLTINHSPGAPPPFQRSRARVWPLRGRT